MSPLRLKSSWMPSRALRGERKSLRIQGVQPVCIQSITAGGGIIETCGEPGDDLPGYAYAGGYLFSGKIAESYPTDYVENLYFTKTCAADQSKADYTVTGKALASRPLST